jgi:hypothetical protein
VFRPASGNAVEHPFGTDVFIDIWPMNTVPIADKPPIRALRRRGV